MADPAGDPGQHRDARNGAALRTWVPRDEFIDLLLASQADPALRDEMEKLTPDTTDDLPL